MKTPLCYLSVALLFLSSCSKTVEAPAVVVQPRTDTIPIAIAPAPAPVLLTDPVNCPPSLYQSNTNAFQFTYARMKLLKGMSGQLTAITPNIIANYNIHIYMRGTSGKYYHLPATTVANVSYNYTLTSAFPQSSFNIKRGAGPEEIFDAIILVGAKASYLSTLNPQLNFADYGTVKMKLGF